MDEHEFLAMDPDDWNQLEKMHHQIRQSGVAAFDSAYLEYYTKLLAQSLEGKSDARPVDRTSLP
jgi:hypothetical protein